MSTCQNYESNLAKCNCSYEPCSRKGKCCECLAYHKRIGELPACYFPDDVGDNGIGVLTSGVCRDGAHVTFDNLRMWVITD